MKPNPTLSVSIFAVLVTAITTGCSPIAETGRLEQNQKRDELESRRLERPVVARHDRQYAGTTQLSAEAEQKAKAAWLRNIKVTLDIHDPIPAKEIVRMLTTKGINITTATPLEDFTYSGYGVKDVDGETALNLLFGSMGLDYSVNGDGHYVTITPIASKTYYLNVSDRQTAFGGGTVGQQSGMGGGGLSSSSQSMMGSSSSTGIGSSGFGGSQGFGQGGQMGGMGGNNQGMGGGFGGGQGLGQGGQMGGMGNQSQGNTIQAQDQFWQSLQREVTQRLTVLVPNRQGLGAGINMPIVPAGSGGVMPPELARINLPNSGQAPFSGNQQDSAGYYTEQQYGNFSMNPATGAITLRAPHWLLATFDEYFKRVERQYNTVIEYEGQIIQVTTKQEDTQGLDVRGFVSFAQGKYGAVVSKNDLGGVTVSLPTAMNSLSAAAGNALPAAYPLIGITSAANKLQLFSSYLSTAGHVKIVQNPSVTTTSGVPVELRKFETQYYFNINQTAASGGVGAAAVGTQNQPIPVQTGIHLRIFPHYDVASGLVRTQISLQQLLQTGTQQQVQYLTVGDQIQQVATEIPIIAQQQFSGETLMKDGDMVIVGGQTEENQNIGSSGITGLKDIDGMGGIFGRKNTRGETSLYYFAVVVHVRTRGT